MAMDETTEEKPVEKKSLDISEGKKTQEEEKIELKLVTAEQNEYGSTIIELQNCISKDLKHATLTFNSYGPNNELTKNIYKETKRECKNWKCGATCRFEFGDSEFVRYAQKCTVTVNVEGEKLVFDLTEDFIGNRSKKPKSRRTKRVVYIHGYQPFGNISEPDFSEEKKMLEKIFPGYEIDCYYWGAAPGLSDFKNLKLFSNYYKKAQNEEPKRLVEYLRKNYWRDLDDLILVGHSLGGVIVANTINLLVKENGKIDRAIFLGTALPAADGAIENFLHAGTHNYSINIHKPEDGILKILKANLEHGGPAAAVEFFIKIFKGPRIFGGDGYAFDHEKSVLLQIKSKYFCNCNFMVKKLCQGHLCKHYLSTLEKFWRLKSEYGK